MAKMARLTSTRSGKRSKMQEAHDSFIFARYVFMVGIVAAIVLLSGLIITLGPMNISIADAYRAILDRFYPGQFDVDLLTSRVVWNIRFPRVVAGILAGFGLGICGCVMQAVLRNPLASPYTLGISSGANFGISIALVLGISVVGGPYLLIGNAFLFAFLCSVFIIGLASIKGANSESLILAGIVVNYFFGAMSQLLHYFADDEQLRAMSSWGMGSLSTFSWNRIFLILGIFAGCLFLLMLKSWDLNIMTSGDETAKSIGVDAEHVRVYIMLISSLLVATVVCFAGTIGFIGLVAPHMARMILGGDHRFLIPASGILGGVILIVADCIALNLIVPTVIPTGIMTSLIGVPFFVYLMLKRRKKEFWA